MKKVVIFIVTILIILTSILRFLPLILAVDANTLYTVGNYNTLGTGFMPSFAYVNGHLIVTYSSCNGFSYGRESMDGGKTWSEAWTVPSRGRGGNIPMMVYNNRIIGFLADYRSWTGTAEDYVILIYSDDYGRTWITTSGFPQKVSSSGGTYCGAYGGCITQDGAFIMGGWYCKTAPVPSDYDFGCFAWVCAKGKDPSNPSNWAISGDVPGSNLDEPNIVERAPPSQGHLSAFLRNDLGGGCGYSESDNYGMTWTSAVFNRGITCPAAPVAVARLSWSPDRIMLVWDNSPSSRSPLVVAISESNGAFGQPLTVATAGNGSSGYYNGPCYPSIQTTSNGVVLGWLYEENGGTVLETHTALLTPSDGPMAYEVTVNAFCDTEGQNILVQATCAGQTKMTPCTFSGLSGSNTLTVPNVDSSGHAFRSWSNGQTTLTLTVSSSGSYTAQYGVSVMPSLDYRMLFAIGAVAFMVALILSGFALIRKLNGRGRRKGRG